MEIRARLPVHTKGTPARTKDRKEVFCAEWRTFHIPEVSRDDMETVFESSEAYSRESRRSPQYWQKNARHHEVRKFEDRLFRLVARDKEEVTSLKMFDLAFPVGWTRGDMTGFRSQISFASHLHQIESDVAAMDPLTRPLYEHLRWHIAAEDHNRIRLANFWPSENTAKKALGPNAIRNGSGLLWERNNLEMDDALSALLEYDHDRLVESRHLADSFMGEFITCDGQLWMGCRPPVYHVHVIHGEFKAVMIDIVHAPSYQDPKLINQYFPLNDKEGALEYANGIALSYAQLGQRMSVTDMTDIATQVYDDAALDFDHAHDELNRMACAYAVENARFLTRQLPYREKFSEETVDAVFKAYDEALKTNFIDGEYGTPEEWLPENAEVWARCGRRQGSFEFGEYEVNTWLGMRAQQLYEDRPINLAIPRSLPSPTR